MWILVSIIGVSFIGLVITLFWVGSIDKKNQIIDDLRETLAEKQAELNDFRHKYGREKKENIEMRKISDRDVAAAIDLYEAEACRYAELNEEMFSLLDDVEQMGLTSKRIYEMLDRHRVAIKGKAQPEDQWDPSVDAPPKCLTDRTRSTVSSREDGKLETKFYHKNVKGD